ncbi:hypothetical protein MSG28_006479 [Choristoneura fumiferana]|uniref:Uncharacterized protein n=2 Tax=Choristoneura fumiferana TaxID=7141 RepID=A0ACC0JF87_CHOFU|nr:hypothetical protein MSG28_006479 [Choristoneura fumiferana]
MYRVLVFVVVLAVVSADSDDDKKKCHRIGHPGTMRCCKSELQLPKRETAELKECFEIPPQPHSCEHDICIGKKRGYASDDGTVDKAAFEKTISEDFSSMPSLLEAVKDNCLTGDLDAFGPPDACELVKLKHCLDMQAINDCKEWDDNGPCAGIKDLVKECAKLMS